jgi:hypothetical protein
MRLVDVTEIAAGILLILVGPQAAATLGVKLVDVAIFVPSLRPLTGPTFDQAALQAPNWILQSPILPLKYEDA